jgi:Ras-related protein Rab-1A
MSNAERYHFKIVVVGNSGVGKSNIIVRYADNKFIEIHMSTIGVDFRVKTIKVDDKLIKLQLWDTAGQERFKSITSSYYKGANAIIIVYDVTSRDSFINLDKWIDDIDKYTSYDVIKVIIGNKTDLTDKRSVSYEEGAQFAKTNGMIYAEASAKNSTGIEELFLKTTQEILEQTKYEDLEKYAVFEPIIYDERRCKCRIL